jgi:hypothetical protein
VVRPWHWAAEARQVKAQRGTPHASIAPRPNRAHEAAEGAQARSFVPRTAASAPAVRPALNCLRGQPAQSATHSPLAAGRAAARRATLRATRNTSKKHIFSALTRALYNSPGFMSDFFEFSSPETSYLF